MALSDYRGPTPLNSTSLPVELIDGITEAVVWSSDPVTRAGAIVSLIREVLEATEWVHASDPRCAEVASLRRLVAAADEHSRRMALLGQADAAQHIRAAS